MMRGAITVRAKEDIIMEQFINALSYPFVQRAVVAGVMISLCAALLGVILVLKRYSLIGHGLGDVGFASTSLAVALGLPVMAVSIPIVIVAACLIMFFSQRSKTGGDTAIGMVATGALSIGVIITALSSGFNVDVNGYMFGSILAMSREDVIFSVLLSVVIIVVFVLFYNRLFLIAFDENFAKASGIHVAFYQFLIALLTALTVVMGMRMMGSLLISSLIIFPAVIARKLVRSFKAVVILSAILSVACFIAGLIVSFQMNLPTGASIVMVNLAILIVVTIFRKFKKM
jgi:zinc transport system permease protein